MTLVQVLIEVANSNVAFISQFQAMIPPTIVQIVTQYQFLVQYLAVAIIVPGILVVILMLLAGLCPCGKCHPGRYGVTKCLIILTDILLIVCFVFYCIFAGLAVVIEYAPPQIASMIDQVTAMCEVMPAEINQLIADNTAAIDQLAASGQDVTELRGQLTDIEGLAATADVGCESMLQLFVEFQALFLPGVCCIVGVLFAMYVNNTLCCVAGCCKHNQRAVDEAEKKKNGDVQLSNINEPAAEMVAP